MTPTTTPRRSLAARAVAVVLAAGALAATTTPAYALDLSADAGTGSGGISTEASLGEDGGEVTTDIRCYRCWPQYNHAESLV